MIRGATALVALAGCDAVFGLDREIDAAGPPVVISGRITQRFLHGNTGLVLVAETVPLIQTEAPTVRSGGKAIDVGWSASEGIFTFEAPSGEPYQLLYGGSEYQLTAPTVMIDRLIPGRPDAIAPAANTVLHAMPTSPLPQGANVYVMSTGTFSVTKPNTVDGSNFTLNWWNADFRGIPSLLSAAAHDEAYLVTFINDAGGYEVLDSYVPLSATLAQGTTTTVPGPVTPVARAQCVTVDPAMITDELARVRALFPAMQFGEPSWTLFNAARPELGLSVAYTLASDHTLDGFMKDVHYGLPFPSFGPVMSYTASSWMKGTGEADQAALSIYYQPLEVRTTCGVQPTPTGVTLALRPKLAGVAITEDVTIGLPGSGDPVLTWEETPGSIAATSYRIALYELVAGQLVERRSILTATPRAVIASELLAVGSTYILDIVTGNGLPDFANGVVNRQVLPYGAGIVRTARFKVSR